MHTKVKNCNSAYKSSCEKFANWKNVYILLIKQLRQNLSFLIVIQKLSIATVHTKVDICNNQYKKFTMGIVHIKLAWNVVV